MVYRGRCNRGFTGGFYGKERPSDQERGAAVIKKVIDYEKKYSILLEASKMFLKCCAYSNENTTQALFAYKRFKDLIKDANIPNETNQDTRSKKAETIRDLDAIRSTMWKGG